MKFATRKYQGCLFLTPWSLRIFKASAFGMPLEFLNSLPSRRTKDSSGAPGTKRALNGEPAVAHLEILHWNAFAESGKVGPHTRELGAAPSEARW